MKVAVLSDIHGNIDALHAVLQELLQCDVEEIWVLGDVVGYYYYPDKVMDLLFGFKIRLIRGNHEVLLEQLIKGAATTAEVTERYGSGHKLAMDVLTEEQKTLLIEAPDLMEFAVCDVRCLLAHGAPWARFEYLYPDSSHEELSRISEYPVDFIFVGHSHYSFVFECDNVTLVNVGSVGQNRKTGGIAEWCLFDVSSREVILRKTPYDVQRLIRAVDELDANRTYLASVLKRKCNE